MRLAPLIHRLITLRSLKSRLLLGLSCALAILAGAVLGMAWQVGKIMVHETNIAHLRYEADLLADEITQQVNQRITALELLSSAMGSANETSWLSYELQKNDALLSWFDGLIVSDEHGEIVADWPSVVGRVGLDSSELEYFKMVRGKRRPYVSEPFIGRASGAPMVLMIVPRLDEERRFAGFVAGMVSLDRSGLFKRLATIRLGDHGFAAVSTASGKILYHPDYELVNAEISHAQRNALLDLALDGWQGEGVSELADGRSSLQAYAQVWPANWVVGLYLPTEQAQLPLSGFISKLFGIWLVISLLMMPLLWWLLARILKPLEHLERQIGEVGAGRRSQLALATGMQELQQVANTFNRVEDERQQLVGHLQRSKSVV